MGITEPRRPVGKDSPHLHICIPAIDERDFLPETLRCLHDQNFGAFTVYICVNQPDEWWHRPDKLAICRNNADTLQYLMQAADEKTILIDRSSAGKGWKGKEGGVGRARKTVMDLASEKAACNDILVSLDADTRFNPGYLSSIRTTLADHPEAAALSVPYYHPLTGNLASDRAILRYEIYMRNYALNLYRISNPYAFTALGSAMAVPVAAYKAIGGMAPKAGGEDFYFLQKLRKYGPVINQNPEKVYPAARFSDRVSFGTGPALIKGAAGDWSSYPVYHYSLFDKVGQTFALFPALFSGDLETPMTGFLEDIFCTRDLWRPLRENFITENNFVRACQQKVDALRILQFLKKEQKSLHKTEEENLCDLFTRFFPEDSAPFLASGFSFSDSPIADLDKLRDFLAEKEAAFASSGQKP